MKFIKPIVLFFILVVFSSSCSNKNSNINNISETDAISNTGINDVAINELQKKVEKLEIQIDTLESENDALLKEKIQLESDLLAYQEISKIIRGEKSEGISSDIEKLSELANSLQDYSFSDINTIDTTDKENPVEMREWVNALYKKSNWGDVYKVKVCVTDFKLGDEATEMRTALKAKFRQSDLTNKQLAYFEVAVALPDNFPLAEAEDCIGLGVDTYFTSSYKDGVPRNFENKWVGDTFVPISYAKAGGVAYGGYFFELPKDTSEFTAKIGNTTDMIVSKNKYAFVYIAK